RRRQGRLRPRGAPPAGPVAGGLVRCRVRGAAGPAGERRPGAHPGVRAGRQPARGALARGVRGRGDGRLAVYERGWRRYGVIALFLGPSVIGLTAFTLLPILSSLGLSFTDWDLLRPPAFVGLSNYRHLLGDPEFWRTLRNTVTFLVGYVPLVLTTGLLVAVLLNASIPFRQVFRAMYFVPVVTSWVAVALVWKWLFNPVYGPLQPSERDARHQGAGVALRPELGDGRGDPHERLEGHRLRHGDHAGGPAGHPARVLRGRQHRRRLPAAGPLPHHDPAARAHADLLPQHQPHRRLPGLRPGLRHDRGRAGRRDHGPRRARGRERLLVQPHGLRLGD